MLDAKVSELLNVQINKEFYSAYLYLDFSNYYADQGLNGFANWYRVQAQEERDHAMLFMQYLQNNGCKVTLEGIDKPDKEFTAFSDPLHAGYEHEQYVTGLIHTIYEAAGEAKDFRTMQFLDWFVKEQGEEIPEYWIVDVRRREIEIYDLDYENQEPKYFLVDTIREENSGDLRLLHFPNIKIDFKQLFDGVY